MYVPFFHVGVMVHDIERATRNFSERLGIEFEPLRTAPTAMGHSMSFRYSIQGPPFLELVQTAGPGIWAPELGEGLHHVGFAEPDMLGRCSLFNKQTDTVVPGEDDDTPRVVFTRPEELHNVRIEYIMPAMVERTFQRLWEASAD